MIRKKRILFVDDETAILQGLSKLLRREHTRWEMAFAPGSKQAIDELEKGPFDVIVSDMRMPGMDGAALLGHVRSVYPGTARLLLSGHSDREAILRAIPVAHQFLSKPCDPAMLRAAIERTCDLHRLLEDESLRRVVGTLQRLPSVPRAYEALTDAANDPSVGIATLTRIIESDTAMSAKVLQLVNSASFGLSDRILSIPTGVNYLGIEMVKTLALTANVFFSASTARPIEGFSLERLHVHSVAVARLAKRLMFGRKGGDEAFSAALLHDIGMVVLAIGMPEQYTEVVREVATSGRPYHEVEQQMIGVTHAQVGAYLLGVWGLPFSIVESVAYHHTPGMLAEGQCDVVAAVHAASALMPNVGVEADSAIGHIDRGFLERSGIGADIERWRAYAAEELANAQLAA